MRVPGGQAAGFGRELSRTGVFDAFTGAVVEMLTGSVYADTLSLHGNFRQLLQGADQDFVILQSIYGPRWKVLKVRQPLNYDQRLAVSYRSANSHQKRIPAVALQR